MINLLNNNQLYSIFSVENFSALESNFSTLPPLMVEYHLSSLSNANNTYINKSKIQDTIYIGEYILYLNYDDNIFLEIKVTSEVEEPNIGILW
jgi:hypothetical protein